MTVRRGEGRERDEGIGEEGIGYRVVRGDIECNRAKGQRRHGKVGE